MQVNEHHNAELGRKARKGNKARARCDRQMKARQVHKPDAADQSKGQGRENQKRLTDFAEGAVKEREDDHKRHRHHERQALVGSFHHLVLTRIGDAHARGDSHITPDGFFDVGDNACQVAIPCIDINPAGQPRVFRLNHRSARCHPNLGDVRQGDALL